jgi:hypothetical protein
MKPADSMKAAGIAAVVLMLDVLLAVGVVYGWSIFIEPGHHRAYYAAAGVPIARLSTRIAGTALIFAASWWAARRNPQRNAVAFAVMVVIYYALMDGVSAGFQDFFTAGTAVTMLLKLVAGIAGALLAVKLHSRQLPRQSHRSTP